MSRIYSITYAGMRMLTLTSSGFAARINLIVQESGQDIEGKNRADVKVCQRQWPTRIVVSVISLSTVVLNQLIPSQLVRRITEIISFSAACRVTSNKVESYEKQKSDLSNKNCSGFLSIGDRRRWFTDGKLNETRTKSQTTAKIQYRLN